MESQPTGLFVAVWMAGWMEAALPDEASAAIDLAFSAAVEANQGYGGGIVRVEGPCGEALYQGAWGTVSMPYVAGLPSPLFSGLPSLCHSHPSTPLVIVVLFDLLSSSTIGVLTPPLLCAMCGPDAGWGWG